MNNEPVKFLPHQTLKPTVYPDSLYQQNWDLKMALDRSRDLTRALIWVSVGGWGTALALIIASRF